MYFHFTYPNNKFCFLLPPFFCISISTSNRYLVVDFNLFGFNSPALVRPRPAP
jgi:hypothetical protein